MTSAGMWSADSGKDSPAIRETLPTVSRACRQRGVPCEWRAIGRSEPPPPSTMTLPVAPPS